MNFQLSKSHLGITNADSSGPGFFTLSSRQRLYRIQFCRPSCGQHPEYQARQKRNEDRCAQGPDRDRKRKSGKYTREPPSPQICQDDPETCTDDNQQLGAKITLLYGQINVANYRLLKLIATFDDRKAWSGGGTVRSCAHWLNWSICSGLTKRS